MCGVESYVLYGVLAKQVWKKDIMSKEIDILSPLDK